MRVIFCWPPACRSAASNCWSTTWCHGAAPASRSRFDGAMVGRERELERLRAAMVEAVEGSSCQLFTVLGAAGVGKSRLAHAFLGGLENVRVVHGTCLSYGEGITYWPVLEVLKQLLGLVAGQRADRRGLRRGGWRRRAGETSSS